MPEHLSHDEFFTQLTTLLTTTHQKGHGSIYLTQKRLTFDTTSQEKSQSQKIPDDPLWDTHPPNPLPLIIRATDGKSQSKDRVKNKQKVKLSTIVQPDDLDAFFTKYAEMCRAGMTGLKKRDRKARKQKKGKKKAGGEGTAK